MDWANRLLTLLAHASLRALIVAAIAWVLLYAGRSRLQGARHAVWTAVTFGMLLSIPAAWVLPPIPLRLLSGAPSIETPATEMQSSSPVAPASPFPVKRSVSLPDALAATYIFGAVFLLFRLALAYRLTRRLVRGARRVETFADARLYESSQVVVPMTVGWLRPKILVPEVWRDWEYGKVKAVIAHEGAHVQRADWAIVAAAALNRSLFWFHPLAWWLERNLARLAEEACDDAALREVEDRDEYAGVLLELAANVRCRGTRIPGDVMAMAGTTEIGMRIDRILDDARIIPLPWTRRGLAGILVCAVPLLWVVFAAELAPARATEPEVAAAPAAPAAPQAREQPPADAPQPPAAPTRKAANSTAARLQPIATVKPDYPAAARKARVQGTVFLTITVAKNGTVTDVTAATGHPLLIPAAAEAVRKWTYAPQHAEMHTHVEIPFVLDATVAVASADKAPDEPTEPATILSRIEPDYPPLAKQMGVHGTVELVATVATDGSVTAVRVVRGHPLLVRAATDAAQRWKYKPRASVIDTRVVLTFGDGDVVPPHGQIKVARLIARREPVYPAEAMRAGVSGLVELIATVGTDGTVTAVRIVKGDPLLAKAAEEAVRQWRYEPCLLNGTPTASETRITLNFVGQSTPQVQPEGALNQPATRPEHKTQGAAAAQESDALGMLKYLVTGSQPLRLIRNAKFAPPRGVHGKVRVKYRIGIDGKPRDIEITDGDSQLAAAFVGALRERIYEPEKLNWQPVVSGIIEESVEFFPVVRRRA